MPKYMSRHFDVIMNLAQTMSQFQPAASLSDDEGWGYLLRLRNYMISQDSFDENELDLQQQLAAYSKTVRTGSGLRFYEPDFTRPTLKRFPERIKSAGESIDYMLKKTGLMQREPLLKSILKYSALQFRQAEDESTEALGYMSDIATLTVTSLVSQLQNLPTQAQLEDFRDKDPEMYEVAEKLRKLIDAYVEYYTPEPGIKAAEADKLDPEQQKQKQIRKLEKFRAALKEFADIPQKNVTDFMTLTGNDASQQQFYDNLYEPNNKSNIFCAVAQTEQQLNLLAQGVSLGEMRLLQDVSAIMKGVKGELSGMGVEFDQMYEPFRTQALSVYDLSKQCTEKLKNGFASEQEKIEFFKRLGTECEKFSDSLININIHSYDGNGDPDHAVKGQATFEMIKILQNNAASPDSFLHRAASMKDRLLALEHNSQWIGRVETKPCYAALKNTGTKYIGEKGSEEYRNYKAMMESFHDVTKLSMKNQKHGTVRYVLGDRCVSAVEKADAYLKGILNKTSEELAAMDANKLGVLKDRTAGILGFMKGMAPQKADALRRKAETLFGHEVTWNEIAERNREGYNRKPNYGRYYELHTGDHAANIPDSKLVEYTAKAASALVYMDDANKKFDVSVPRKFAENIMTWPDFKAAVRAYGRDKLREALTSGDPKKIANIVTGSKERYAVSDNVKSKLKALSDRMETANRSKKWGALKSALADGNMKDSKKVFEAIEGYVKGKKSVSSDAQRKESVDLALDALAIVAESGDEVAKARAQILVDRFNHVRDARQGDRNHIDLSRYGKNVEPANNQPGVPVQPHANHV